MLSDGKAKQLKDKGHPVIALYLDNGKLGRRDDGTFEFDGFTPAEAKEKLGYSRLPKGDKIELWVLLLGPDYWPQNINRMDANGNWVVTRYYENASTLRFYGLTLAGVVNAAMKHLGLLEEKPEKEKEPQQPIAS